MTATDLYYLDEQLSPEEARHGWQGVVYGDDIRPVEVDAGGGYYTVAIRRRGRPGFVFRFRTLGADVFETLNRLNGRVMA